MRGWLPSALVFGCMYVAPWAHAQSCNRDCPRPFQDVYGCCPPAKVVPAPAYAQKNEPDDPKACGSGDRDACIRAGTELESRASRIDGPLRNTIYQQAMAFYTKACEKGHSLGCMSVAVMFERGMGVAPDPAKARELFVRAMSSRPGAGSAGGGTRGLGRSGGRGGSKGASGSPAAGPAAPDVSAQSSIDQRSIFEKACKLGNMSGCASLAMTSESSSKGNEAARALALALFRRACTAGHMDACKSLARLMEADGERSVTRYEMECDRGEADSCLVLASFFAAGTRVPRDEARASELERRVETLYSETCEEAKNGEICLSLAKRYETRKPARAATLFRKACDAKSAVGCHGAAQIYTQGKGVPKDTELAKRLMDKACSLDGDFCE
ncbi:MAG: sel1 repeat family protein [Deltaproteobacteria bacterium]|nr:sel1 repeat family protein [Deltaproteobacteria bacterium]